MGQLSTFVIAWLPRSWGSLPLPGITGEHRGAYRWPQQMHNF